MEANDSLSAHRFHHQILEATNNPDLNYSSTSYGYFTLAPPAPDELRRRRVRFYDVPEQVSSVMVVGYHGVVPCLVVIGIIINILCISIICRPKLKNIHINKYLKFLVVVDLVTYACCLLDSLARPFCFPSSYTLAFYKAHFGGKLVYLCRYISVHGLIWMSFDRFLATWFPTPFPLYKKPGVVGVRLTLSVIWAVLWGIPILYMGTVEEYPYFGNENAINNSRKWLVNPVYTQNLAQTFLLVFSYCDLVLNIIVPGIALIALNISLLAGVTKKLLGSGMSREVSKTAAVLVINVLYVVSYIPIFFINTSEHCISVTVNELIWEITVDSSLIVWSIINMFIVFVFNREYRKELRYIIPVLSEGQIKFSSTWFSNENLTTKGTIHQ
ncbi:unnamed protein product [Meganyctiphanes norvegica]|uniref:G-protein coupled receptors family 1 profile domain-containing protein n=1 Tax=Meganyctiphanes norvegica TaxID=48144 RepID=A0AAV2QHJ0_MEGNR